LQLHSNWKTEFTDIVGGVPERLPPRHVINHKINLIDDKKTYHYRTPCCFDNLKEQLREKIEGYMRAGWWEARAVAQAAPMLCIPKKTSKL
jgi:hypothetical protein